MSTYLTYTLLLFGLFFNLKSYAQTPLEILYAETISFNKKQSEDRQVLKGDVKVKHDNRYLTCDSAYFYSEENKIEAFSNIHLWEGDSLNLWGDYLLYDGNRELAEITHQVLFTHNEMRLNTHQLHYHFKNEKAYFNQKAHIKQGDKSLESLEGVYYTVTEKFDFFNDVKLNSLQDTLTADTLYYWLATEFANFKSNGVLKNKDFHILAHQGWLDQLSETAFLTEEVSITNLKDSSNLKADTCYLYDRMSTSKSFGNLLISFPFEEDTLQLTTDTLYQNNTDSSAVVLAYNNVLFNSQSLSGSCDSLSYNQEIDSIALYNSPVLWLNNYQISADTISVFLKENKLEEVLLHSNSFICSEVDSNYYDQISGKDMVCYFNQNEINHIDVIGNGECVYFVKEESSEEIKGFNKIICSNMNILLRERQIHKISFFTKPDAHLIPISQSQVSDYQLKNFFWAEKPNILADLFLLLK